MQYEELISKYLDKIEKNDFNNETGFYACNIGESTRIYYSEYNRNKRDMNFVIHIHPTMCSVVKFLYNDEMCIYVFGNKIRIEGGTESHEVRTADEYFNVSLSTNITIPFSLLKSIQDNISPKDISVTFFMDELIEYTK